MKYIVSFFTLIVLCSCNGKAAAQQQDEVMDNTKHSDEVSLLILGNLQDAGSPHIACKKECCTSLFATPDATRKVVSLGLIDPENKKTYLFEATPDITAQLKIMKQHTSWEADELPSGIFLTHAHMGHYTGLMYLGKEATNAKEIRTYAMPKMKGFLEKNGPWSQLVSDKNIKLIPLEQKIAVQLSSDLQVIFFLVFHRDEYSETVGYTIVGLNKRALLIPDIDKWEKWETSITAEIAKVDYAFLDATFYDGEELNNRDVSQIPHPFVSESMALFKNLRKVEKQKIYFIHFNHTNPLLNPKSKQSANVLFEGYNIAQFGDRFSL